MTTEVPSNGLELTNLTLGAALACAAILLGPVPAAAWNAGIVGALIVFCSFRALYRFGRWAEWSNVVLGSWAVVAPFLLGFGSASFAMWTHVTLGFGVAGIAIAQLAKTYSRAT